MNLSKITIKTVQKITGISARRLRWWGQQGLIRPSGDPGRKYGQTRYYSLRDILCALMIKALRDRGISLQKIRESVGRVVITGVEQPLAKLRVACLAHSVVFKRDGKFVEPISGQMVIEEALETVRPHLERKRFAPAERSIKKANLLYEKQVAGF